MAKSKPNRKRPAIKPRGQARAELLSGLRDYIRANTTSLLAHPNVTSVGIGYKITDDRPSKEICLQFTVKNKAEPEVLETLGLGPALPKAIVVGGVAVPTDVIERDFKPAYQVVTQAIKDLRKQRVDPMMPGVSVSHPLGTAGTLGAIVFDVHDGSPCILSNWHVLHTPDGSIGDQTVQPGPFDDNRVDQNVVGTLVRSHLGIAGDCAIARIEQRGFVREVYELGVQVKQLGRPDLGDRVVKSGRTSGVTSGVVRRIDTVAKINYGGSVGEQQVGCFEIGPDPDRPNADGEVSQGGDSGSAWLATNTSSKPSTIMVGLHFAGEGDGDPDEHALACYISSVFEKLEISIEPVAAPAAGLETVTVKRTGYNGDFLDTAIPAPTIASSAANDVAKLSGSPLIPYVHFSVCLSKARRFAYFVAWNIDGGKLKSLSRKGLNFEVDPRVDEDFQAGNELYSNNRLDRGHLARRADLVWGGQAEASQANKDSFFYTNITPQHEAFNQSEKHGLWGLLENAIFEDVDVDDLHVSVFGGPIFKVNDRVYRGVQIPSDFWKVIAYEEDDRLKAKAYILTQDDLLNEIEALELDPFRLFQVSIAQLEQRTVVRFSKVLKDADAFVVEPEMEAAGKRRSVREIDNRAQI